MSMSVLEQNLKHLVESAETETSILDFIQRYSKILDKLEANALLETELLTKLSKAVDLLLK